MKADETETREMERNREIWHDLVTPLSLLCIQVGNKTEDIFVTPNTVEFLRPDCNTLSAPRLAL